jgi:hypothetical protein
MLHQIYFTDWHQILFVAAGFLTAILIVWLQFWVRSFYEERAYDTRPESDRRFSVHIAGLWLFVGVFLSLLAFGFTGLDWLFTRFNVYLPASVNQIPMERLAAGFLIGAFDITLLAVLQQIIDVGRGFLTRGNLEPVAYTPKKKWCILIAVCIALILISVVTVILLAVMPPLYWLYLILGSFIIPFVIVGGTYLWALLAIGL